MRFMQHRALLTVPSSKKLAGRFHQVLLGFIDVSHVFIGVSSIINGI